MVQAIHTAIKGRARYQVPELYRSPSLQNYLERWLPRQAGIHKVSANSLTGNLLVHFQREKAPHEVATLIEEGVSTYRQKGKDAQQPGAEAAKEPVEAQAQPTQAWHLMDVDAVLEQWQSSQATGLSDETVEDHLDRYGRNVIAQLQTRSDWTIFIEQFQTVPVALLGAAAGLSIVTGGLADALVIGGVVFSNAIVGYFTESQSEKVIRSLVSGETKTALVLRDGNKIEIDADDIVPGDILVLQANSYVVADGRLIAANHLSINESALTGESIPVTKQTQPLSGEEIPLAERDNMVYRGTFIAQGSGLAVVVATGKFTEMGKIQGMVSETQATETPLQQQLDEVSSQLVLLGTGICGLVFGIGLLRGYGFLQILQTSISLAVASVPEGLPTVATSTLALGIQDMRKHKILMRSLNAVEALGSVQTICLDKTGTLTLNQMVVVEVHINTGVLTHSQGQFVTEAQEPLNPNDNENFCKLIQVCILCSESKVNREQEAYQVKGSATENALIYMAVDAGIDVIELRQQYPLLKTYPRSENRNLMTTVHQMPEEQRYLVAVKGSPEEVLERCNAQMRDGEVLPLDDDDRQRLSLENERMAGKALRVLGVAFRYLEDPEQEAERELIWLGLTGMADPLREGLADLMEGFHRAGINPVMITGDQSATAYAIAKQLHLSRDRNLEILDSSDLAHVDPEKMQALCDKVDVFARISPADKLQIVQALQATGKVVAMTGDGINDTPALKAANVGVAMGSGVPDVVREVADVVIEDNNLQTLINAVSQGRTIYSNIRKAVHFLLSTNLSEIMVTLTATAIGLGEPLTAVQLLWLNLVSDVFPALGLALEPPEPDVLERPPRDPEEPIVKTSDFQRIALESAVISASTLTAYGYGLVRYGISPRASTTSFMTLTIAQVLHTLSCRSEDIGLFDSKKLPRNPYLEAAVAGSLAIQLVPIAFPPLRGLLKIVPLDLFDWLVIAGCAVVPLIVNESLKLDSREQSDLEGQNHEQGLRVHI